MKRFSNLPVKLINVSKTGKISLTVVSETDDSEPIFTNVYLTKEKAVKLVDAINTAIKRVK